VLSSVLDTEPKLICRCSYWHHLYQYLDYFAAEFVYLRI